MGTTFGMAAEMKATMKVIADMKAALSVSRKMSVIKESLNFKVMDLRIKIRKEDRELQRTVMRRIDIQEWIDNSTPRVVVVDNHGEEDSIQFGVTVDKQSHLEGWGSEPKIKTPLFLAIKAKEEKIEEVENQISDNYSSLCLVGERIEDLKKEIEETITEYGKAMPQDEAKLASLEKWEDKLEGWIKSGQGYLKFLHESIIEMERRDEIGNDADKKNNQDEFNAVHWKGVHEYGERLIIKLKRIVPECSNKKLILMIKRVNQLRYGDKVAMGTSKVRKAGKQITFKHWVMAWWLINRELYKRTNNSNYKDKIEKCKMWWEKYELGKVKENKYKIDPEAEVHGSASLSEDEMLEAIDKMWPTKRELDLAIVFVQNRNNRKSL